MAINRSKSKPEVEFQYGGRPFSENGSSNTSAVDWAISSKFGVQIDLDTAKRVRLLKPKPEIDFQLYGRNLDKSIWRPNFVLSGPVWMKFDRQVLNHINGM